MRTRYASVERAVQPLLDGDLDSSGAAALFESFVANPRNNLHSLAFRRSLALHSARSLLACDVARALSKAGVDLDKRLEYETEHNRMSRTLLHFAVESGSPDFVATLLDLGANPDAPVLFKSLSGAETSAPLKYGLSAGEATRSTRPEIHAVIQSWAARRQIEGILCERLDL